MTLVGIEYATFRLVGGLSTGCSFMVSSHRSQGHSAAGKIYLTKNPNDPSGNRTRNLPARRCTQYRVFIHGELSQSLNSGTFWYG